MPTYPPTGKAERSALGAFEKRTKGDVVASRLTKAETKAICEALKESLDNFDHGGHVESSRFYDLDHRADLMESALKKLMERLDG